MFLQHNRPIVKSNLEKIVEIFLGVKDRGFAEEGGRTIGGREEALMYICLRIWEGRERKRLEPSIENETTGKPEDEDQARGQGRITRARSVLQRLRDWATFCWPARRSPWRRHVAPADG